MIRQENAWQTTPNRGRLAGGVITGILTTVIVIIAIWSVDLVQLEKQHLQNRAQVQDALGVVRANLEAALNRRLHLIQGLSAFVITNPRFSETEFHTFVQELGAKLEGVRSLQLAPNAVVTHIHPLAGNEAARGHDLLADAQRRDAVVKAIEKKRFIIAGPMDLLQGGRALVGRIPIFLAPPGRAEREKNSGGWPSSCWTSNRSCRRAVCTPT
ncbi:MAG: CHASE domain-containing protein [Magnetococcales bacterium]|nr:CHASE domain-containing protein [Magnetococcales bacterium]